MRTLTRAVSRPRRGGASLPEVFTSFTAMGISIRRGEVTMIAAQPGVGKSTLALRLALTAKVPTLYFSADTHAHTMAIRSISMLSHHRTDVAEAYMESNQDWAKQILKDADHVKWCFDPAPSMQDIEEEVQVYREVMGCDPQLIVVDNAVDVTHDTGDEFSSLRSLMREAKWWARDTDAAFLILHHTSEAVDGNPCPPRRSIHGKVAQVPALILTLANPREGVMAVAPVKNRYAKAQADGALYTELAYVPENMWLGDLTPAAVSNYA